jgi:hypothetical protein
MAKMKTNLNNPVSQSPPKQQASNGFYPNNNNNGNFNNGNGGYNNYNNNNNGNGYKPNNNNGNGYNGAIEASKPNYNGNAAPKFNAAPISGQQLNTQSYLPSSVQPNTGSYKPSLLEYKNKTNANIKTQNPIRNSGSYSPNQGNFGRNSNNYQQSFQTQASNGNSSQATKNPIAF